MRELPSKGPRPKPVKGSRPKPVKGSGSFGSGESGPKVRPKHRNFSGISSNPSTPRYRPKSGGGPKATQPGGGPKLTQPGGSPRPKPVKGGGTKPAKKCNCK